MGKTESAVIPLPVGEHKCIECGKEATFTTVVAEGAPFCSESCESKFWSDWEATFRSDWEATSGKVQ